MIALPGRTALVTGGSRGIGRATAIAAAAQARAHQFSWDHSMEALFGRLYPAAFSRRSEQRISSAGVVPATLAKA